MEIKIIKKHKVLYTSAITGIFLISLTNLIGCGVKEPAKGNAVNKEITAQKTSANSNEADGEKLKETEAVINEKTQNIKDNKEVATVAIKKQSNPIKLATVSKETIKELKPSNGKNDLTGYINLIGLSKEKLISTLKENPNSVDEGGLEFKEAGIRVWFDKKNNAQVEQIFIVRKDKNLNGVKIGDKISSFKKVFGKPVSDKNGDAHFKYNSIFLSVNYDTKTEETYAVYILKNDF
jgi:hypothetical protein